MNGQPQGALLSCRMASPVNIKYISLNGIFLIIYIKYFCINNLISAANDACEFLHWFYVMRLLNIHVVWYLKWNI